MACYCHGDGGSVLFRFGNRLGKAIKGVEEEANRRCHLPPARVNRLGTAKG